MSNHMQQYLIWEHAAAWHIHACAYDVLMWMVCTWGEVWATLCYRCVAIIHTGATFHLYVFGQDLFWHTYDLDILTSLAWHPHGSPHFFYLFFFFLPRNNRTFRPMCACDLVKIVFAHMSAHVTAGCTWGGGRGRGHGSCPHTHACIVVVTWPCE